MERWTGANQTAYEEAFPEADRACATANPNTCEGYELMADVDLSGTDWAPIGIFEKVFDGNGHTIDNLTIDIGTDGLLNVGLFSELFGTAAVRNLGLTGVSVTVTNDTTDAVSVGGLAGKNAGPYRTATPRGRSPSPVKRPLLLAMPAAWSVTTLERSLPAMLP